jgi:hypothetical protein
MHPYAFLAMDIAQDRAHEADRHRLAAIARADAADQTIWPRRVLARAFASITRVSAWVTRRLDGYVADDLERSLTPTK